MQKCVTIYSNIRTTHKYYFTDENWKIYYMHIYVKIYPYKQASYFSKNVLNNSFNSKHVQMYHSDTVHIHTQ
jgi:hypothetical protein